MSCFTCRDCGSINLLPLEPRIKNTQSSDSLVSKILRGQRPLLDSDHALVSAEIVELEQLQSLYAAQLEEIQLHRRAVLTALESRKSISASIHRLPRDILIEIFHSVCDSWWQKADEDWSLRYRRHSLNVSGPLWVLGRVLQAPFSKYTPEILQTYLEHTGEHLLNLQVSFRVRKSAKDDEILSLLVQSCQRWKILRISATKSHMSHLESISHIPALQTVGIDIYDAHDSDYWSDMCLGAPQLWHACLQGHGLRQIRLPPGITHFSGSITCSEDLHLLSQLPKLRRCHLWITPSPKDASVVTMAQLSHLYVMDVDILNVLSAPLLSSLTINYLPQGSHTLSAQESITRFLHRSRCLLENLSVSAEIFTSAIPSRMFALEACSTISRIKLGLPPRMINGIVEAFTSPSVLPKLQYLILCISEPSQDECATILRMVRSRRDGGLLKLVEVQLMQDKYKHYLEEDIRAINGGDFEMRFEKWNPPFEDHFYLWHLP
ncbi:uncharacterized protein ARMOST_19691 [Armillaria ostoyae]|uniref:F-box domain-containing protein n=1 Tax=Armillaria ostoyae TaxID=47428 RepID=A0A284S588_ARMOS|nr:uncharacterized protein ARMOST_19691 [Armillaria ostoyae]